MDRDWTDWDIAVLPISNPKTVWVSDMARGRPGFSREGEENQRCNREAVDVLPGLGVNDVIVGGPNRYQTQP